MRRIKIKIAMMLMAVCATSAFAAESLIVKPPTEKTQLQAVKELMKRRLPKAAASFSVAMIPQEAGFDVFEVESSGDKVMVRGSSGVAIATGWHWYLKHVCQQHMSWCGSRMDLTSKDIKPVPNGKFRQVMPQRKITYMNYCTLSYNMAWWDWERWEWECDFMAMNGINMPLGVVGVEGVWYNALLRVGLTDLEARAFLSGPAYHAWQWMQNLEGGAGPLPKSWIDSHIALGKKITDRQRSLGMTPIQQGFSGHVPRKFKEKFPQANIRLQGNWCDFPGVAQLDPLDPFFNEFGKIFMEEEGKLFGLGGYYAADPFHESQPPKDITKEELPKYLASVGQSIHRVFDEIDPKSTWVMQSWTILADIAKAAPIGRLMVLDLAGDKWTRTEGFWGHQFTTGQLHNFGGRIELHGNLPRIADNPFMKANVAHPKMTMGTGLFMEGIQQNPVFYDIVMDTWWQDKAFNVDEWVKGYVARRYGASGGSVEEAWKLMTTDGPYKKGAAGIEWGSMVCARPALNCIKSGPNGQFKMEYKPASLLKAWKLLLADQARCGASEGYRFDVVDVGRQVLSNYAKDAHENVRLSFLLKDKEGFKKNTNLFIDLLRDVDRICETRKEYRFEEWLKSARGWGKTEEEIKLYDKNASILLTLWGPEEKPYVNFDYAWREWSGLIREFYIPRWQKFHSLLANHLETGKPYSEDGIKRSCDRPSWRSTEFFTELAAWETQWVNTPKDSWKKLDVGSGDELKVADALMQKWTPVIEAELANTKQKEAQIMKVSGVHLAYEWGPGILSNEAKEIDIDCCEIITGEGNYQAEVKFVDGSNAVSIEYIALIQQGVEIMRDTHAGWAGNAHRDNIYKLKLDVIANGAKYGLKMKIKGEGGGNSKGQVIIRKVTNT